MIERPPDVLMSLSKIRQSIITAAEKAAVRDAFTDDQWFQLRTKIHEAFDELEMEFVHRVTRD